MSALSAPAKTPRQRTARAADGDKTDSAPTIQISADDSATTHWPCGSIVPEMFRAGEANFCPRCHRVV